MIRIQKLHDTQDFTPAQGTQLGWQVENIKAEVKNLGMKGIEFQRFAGMNQDELGIWNSPAGAKVAWFKDPDGNNLSLTQFP